MYIYTYVKYYFKKIKKKELLKSVLKDVLLWAQYIDKNRFLLIALLYFIDRYARAN